MSLKLLIADDEEVIRNGITKYIKLHSDRFDRIYTAENGKEAVELILKYRPDMVLLDVQMPVKNGLDVMKETQRAGLDPVIVVLSGYDEFKYAQAALRGGAKEYMLKPARGVDVLECLNNLADKYLSDEKHQMQSDTGKNILIDKIKEYIHEHYMDNINLNIIADEMGVSSGYISFLFPKETGMGFVDYLNHVRIERACSYLEQNYFKTYEIAYRVGYNDEKYFSKVFKKIKGITPKEYRLGSRMGG